MMTPVFKKLNYREQNPILILNAPETFEPLLRELSEIRVVRDLATESPYPFILAFITQKADLDALTNALVVRTQDDSILWIAYPKGSSRRYSCDFNRDTGWEQLRNAGFDTVRQVAIDEDWSALRFRRIAYIKKLSQPRDVRSWEASRP